MNHSETKMKSYSPVDGRELKTVNAVTAEDVASAVAKANQAQPGWAAMSFDDRAKRLTAACRQMLENRHEILTILRLESGKYPCEGLLSEAIAPLDQLKHWIKIIRPYLRAKKLPISPVSFPGKKARTEMLPRGVIGVIAPWNYPMANLFKPVLPALLCGNAVVIKPSEQAPRAADWFVRQIQNHIPPHTIQCVHGGGDTGQELIRSGIQGLVFTGSPQTGRVVLKSAAEQLIPCSAELGGKDPAIVLEDCDIERTVAGIVNWAFHNTGQNCGAIERVYVLPGIADVFTGKIKAYVSRLRITPAEDMTIDISPMNNEKQLVTVERHVEDALRKGAELLCGGKRFGNGLGYEPTVLDGCDHSMLVMTEETFGPVLPIMRVPNEQEAIRLANDSLYGLNASVWTKNIRRGKALADAIEAGTVNINNHAITGAMPFAPWCGVKQSGYGIANSVYSLSVFTRPKTILTDSNTSPDPWWFPFDHNLLDIGQALAEIQTGKWIKAAGLLSRLAKRKNTIRRHGKGNA